MPMPLAGCVLAAAAVDAGQLVGELVEPDAADRGRLLYFLRGEVDMLAESSVCTSGASAVTTTCCEVAPTCIWASMAMVATESVTPRRGLFRRNHRG